MWNAIDRMARPAPRCPDCCTRKKSRNDALNFEPAWFNEQSLWYKPYLSA
jgi:hypothetical protein